MGPMVFAEGPSPLGWADCRCPTNPAATAYGATTVPAAAIVDAVRVAHAYISNAIVALGLTRPNGETFSRARQVLGTIRKLADKNAEQQED